MKLFYNLTEHFKLKTYVFKYIRYRFIFIFVKKNKAVKRPTFIGLTITSSDKFTQLQLQ